MRRRTLWGLLALIGPSLASRAEGQVVDAELWTLTTSLRQSFTDNLFVTSVAKQADFVTAATVGLSYLRVRRDSSFGAFGWANGQAFARLDGYNQGQFGLGVSRQREINRRFQWRYSGAYSDGINLEVLYGGGGGLPQVDVKSGILSTGTTFALTPRTSWSTSLDGTYLRYRSRFAFDSAALPISPLPPIDIGDAVRPPSTTPPSLVLPDGTDILRLLAAESVLTQRLDYWSWRLGTGLTHAFSPKTSANLGIGYRFNEQSPRTFDGGDHFETTVGLTRVLDPTANLSGGYAYQSSDYGRRSSVHSGSIQADKQFGNRWRADASLGVSYLDEATSRSSGWTWIGGLGTSVRFDRGNLAGRYTRTVYQGQIVPTTQVTDSVFVGGGHAFTKRVFASAFGFYRSARDRDDPRFSYDSGYLVAALSVRMGRRTSTGLSYVFQTFDQSGLPRANRSYLTASFGYTRSWK